MVRNKRIRLPSSRPGCPSHRAEFASEVAELNETIAAQQQRIERLRQVAAQQQQMAEDADKRFCHQMTKLGHELEWQTGVVRDMEKVIEARKHEIREEIEARVTTLRTRFEDRIAVVEREDSARTELAVRALSADVARSRHGLADARDHVEGQLESRAGAARRELDEIKATIVAKVVRDQLRFDHFLRDVERRFSAFGGGEALWGLRADQVREAERLIARVEEGVARACPIAGFMNSMKAAARGMTDFAAFVIGGT